MSFPHLPVTRVPVQKVPRAALRNVSKEGTTLSTYVRCKDSSRREILQLHTNHTQLLQADECTLKNQTQIPY